MNQDNLIEVRDLAVEFGFGERVHRVVEGVSFDIKRGETLGGGHWSANRARANR